MENPPLGVWAIIIGAIIASKFIYRWYATKQFAKEDQERRIRKIKSDDKTRDLRNNNDSYGNNINRSYYTTNITFHKYSPRRFYIDYFAIKKKRKR